MLERKEPKLSWWTGPTLVEARFSALRRINQPFSSHPQRHRVGLVGQWTKCLTRY